MTTEQQSAPSTNGHASTQPNILRRIRRSNIEDYSERFKDFFVFERSNGVIEARMHVNGGTPNIFHGDGVWCDVFSQVFREIGNDPENKVMILTSTGEYWFYDEHYDGLHSLNSEEALPVIISRMYQDAMKSMEEAIFGLYMPTIGVINGPAVSGVHVEPALACDITLAADDAAVRDPHFEMSIPPGDGQGLMMQHFLGTKVAAYHLYTGLPVDAQKMLQYGMVNEVLPRETLMTRAREIGQYIAQRGDVARLATSQIVRRPLRKAYQEDLSFQHAHELLSLYTEGTPGVEESIRRGREYVGLPPLEPKNS